MKRIKILIGMAIVVFIAASAGWLKSATTWTYSGPQGSGTLTITDLTVTGGTFSGITNSGTISFAAITASGAVTVTGKTTANGELEANADVDINLGTASEEITIDQTNVAGTASTPMMKITDVRTGTTANETTEATIEITSSGIYAMAIANGILGVDDEIDAIGDITIDPAGNDLIVDATVDATAYTADAAAGIDVKTAGALSVGVTTATSVNYGSSSVTAHTFTSDGTGTAEVVLPAGSIDSTEILDSTVANADLAGSITGNKLVAGTVSNANMAANSVDSSQMVAGSVDNAHLAGSITGNKFVAGTVSNVNLATGLDSAKLLAGSKPPAINGGSITNINGDSCAGVGDVVALIGSKTEVITTPIYTVITFTNILESATDGTAEGESAQVFDFDAGEFTILGAIVNASIVSGTGVVDTFAVAFGTVAASDAADLTSTEVDVIPSTTIQTTGGTVRTNTFDAVLAVPANFDGTATAKDLYFNLGVADAGISGGSANTFVMTGTLTLITTKAVDNQ